MAMFLSRIKKALNLGTKSITQNGTYNASSDGYDGYSSVEVNVAGVIPTPITPSNASPAALTSGTAVSPTGNGYAIESYTEVVPSNASPVTLSNGSIYKIKTNGGKAVASITNVTPSSTPTSVSANDVVKFGGSGVIVDSVPTPTSLTPSNSTPATITSGATYTATTGGKAIASYSEVAPSNANPPDMYSGSIYKIKTRNGLLISTASLVSPSDSNPPQLIVADTYYRINGASGYLYASSGLGKCKSGTFTSSTSSQTINLGFQPKYILIMSSALTTNIFDYSYSSTKGIYATANAGATEYTISGNTSNNHISAITSTGFTFNKSGSSGTTIYYFAMA